MFENIAVKPYDIETARKDSLKANIFMDIMFYINGCIFQNSNEDKVYVNVNLQDFLVEKYGSNVFKNQFAELCYTICKRYTVAGYKCGYLYDIEFSKTDCCVKMFHNDDEINFKKSVGNPVGVYISWGQ